MFNTIQKCETQARNSASPSLSKPKMSRYSFPHPSFLVVPMASPFPDPSVDFLPCGLWFPSSLPSSYTNPSPSPSPSPSSLHSWLQTSLSISSPSPASSSLPMGLPPKLPPHSAWKILSSRAWTRHLRFASRTVLHAVASTLGPHGRDKLLLVSVPNEEFFLQETSEQEYIITNDGATVLHHLETKDPVVRLFVRLAKAQDAKCGDGTTGVVLICASLIEAILDRIDSGVHIGHLYKTYDLVSEILEDSFCTFQNKISLLSIDHLKCVISTCLASKSLRHEAEFISSLLIQSVFGECVAVEKGTTLATPSVISVAGKSLRDSFVVNGIVIRKPISFAGDKNAPKRIENASILLLDFELEQRKKGKEKDPLFLSAVDFDRAVHDEYESFYRGILAIASSSCHVVLSSQSIGDYAVQLLASHGIFAAGRIPASLLHVLGSESHATLLKKYEDIFTPSLSSSLGKCGLFEEISLLDETYIFLTNLPQASRRTIFLHGISTDETAECVRAIDDAVGCIRVVLETGDLIPGGGWIDAILSHRFECVAKERSDITSAEREILEAVSDALWCIPRTLAHNSRKQVVTFTNSMRQVVETENLSSEVCYSSWVRSKWNSSFDNTTDMMPWEILFSKKTAIELACRTAFRLCWEDSVLVREDELTERENVARIAERTRKQRLAERQLRQSQLETRSDLQ